MYPEIHKNPKNLDTQKKITVLTILNNVILTVWSGSALFAIVSVFTVK